MNDTTTTIPCHLRTVRGTTEPVAFVRDGHVYASSEDVAAYFGKQHFHVLRTIKRLILNDKSCASNFGWTYRVMQMPTGGTRDIPICTMTRDGFTLLAMGFTGKRALAWKLKYIEAFNAMEAAIAKPQPKPRDERQPSARLYRYPVDQMDAGLDLLLTARTALHAEGWIDRETVTAIRGTIDQALYLLAPVRDRIDTI